LVTNGAAIVLPERRVLPLHTDRTRARMPHLAGAMLVLLSAVAVGAASCTGAVTYSHRAHLRMVARTHQPESATSVLTGAPDVLAAGVAQRLFAVASVVVVANPNLPADLAIAAAQAERAHAPLLLTAARSAPGPASGGAPGSGTAVSAALLAEIKALHASAVLAVGLAGKVLSARLPGIPVVTNPARLPVSSGPMSLAHVVMLVRQGDSTAATTAAITTARVAGVQVVAVHGYDPRADPAAITALCAARPRQVLAIGASFGPAGRLAARVAVAVTGVQLPGGGQILFPRHRLVALYGDPGTPGLGALGQQDLAASIARARRAAAPYRALSSVPVIPAFEIIASVAQRSPGPDGSYSAASPGAVLGPGGRRATGAGMYVVLDLQAGRASLLAQARRYEPLLKLPNVGLAIDPEWKLQRGQLPLHQIGSVSITEANSVINWLADLTARYHLPQKLLVLHQFRLSMISDERRLDTRHDDLAIVIHMDGQGTQAEKQQTWDSVIGAAPAGVFFGWKNFYVKDHPVLSPRQTMARTPEPVMISYQ